jgi:hypothetical protein
MLEGILDLPVAIGPERFAVPAWSPSPRPLQRLRRRHPHRPPAGISSLTTLDSSVRRDYYGNNFGVQLEPLALAFADIGAVEALARPDALFANGFE